MILSQNQTKIIMMALLRISEKKLKKQQKKNDKIDNIATDLEKSTKQICSTNGQRI